MLRKEMVNLDQKEIEDQEIKTFFNVMSKINKLISKF